MRLLVTGSDGQLGRAVLRAAAAAGVTRIGLARRDLDITDRRAVQASVAGADADLVVNCAAYTAVDHAEAERDAAFRVNRDGAGHLAEASAGAGIPLIHLSTDYVFDGEKGAPYLEDDPINPLNVYGASKAAGEAAVRARNPAHLILRTSWLYGAQGHNFVRTMLRLAAAQTEIRVVGDQRGCPTAAPDLADAILRLAALAASPGMAWGTYHCCNAGEASWFELASAVFERAGPARPRLVPVTTAEFARPARRPRRSALDCGRLGRVFGIEMRPWRAALAPVLDRLRSQRQGQEATA